MVFGSCCYISNNRLKEMISSSVKIEGIQQGLIVNFEVTQAFSHTEEELKEVRYVFPNDLKICIYDTTFIVGEKVIKPKLEAKDEAEKTYKEAIDSGHTAVYGTNINDGLTEFKLGNVPPRIECKVILKIVLIAQKTSEKNFFIKFPLDVFTPSGSKGCLNTTSSQFLFKIQSEKEKISKITSNIINGKFDDSTKIFSIEENIKSHNNQNSIIVTFESNENIKSSAFLSQNSSTGYNDYAITISPNLQSFDITHSEFIFLVDCSGSMTGTSIQKASQCLDLFIRSLPPNSFFNIYKFGSSFKKLFSQSTEYNDETAQKAIELAKSLSANLGGTNIFEPLQNIFNDPNKHGQRQIFILTDGEVFDVEKILQLVSKNSNQNRCFTIGIGRGCDAGLVEGIANASCGKSDFVQEGDSISEKVIPQLQSSLHSSLNSIEIHFDGQKSDSFMVSPYPIPSINVNGSSVIFVHVKKDEKAQSDDGILITGILNNETVEIPIENIELLTPNTGCENTILPLFAFNYIKNIEQKHIISEIDKKNVIEVSISSGVLSKFTGYVGMIKLEREYDKIYVQLDCCCSCARALRCYDVYDDSDNDFQFDEDCKYEEFCSEKHLEQNDEFDFMLITQLQKVTGFWEDLGQLNNIFGLNVDHIDNVNVSDKTTEKRCIATILALAALRVKSSNKRNSWLMIEKKAIDWLKGELPKIDVEQIIQNTLNLF